MVYVTKQDYFDFSGIDLDIELRKSNSDNPSKAVEIFIKRVEDFCMNYLKHNYLFSDSDFEEKFDEVAFKKGVMHQIDYIRRNGDITINNPTNIRILAKNAFIEFKMAGMCNTTLPKVDRVIDRWL